MTTEELISAMNKVDDEIPAGEHKIKIDVGEAYDHRDFKISFDKVADLQKLKKLQQLLCEWQASSVRLYRVRISGLNSDNGPQYLTCKYDIHGRVFACALNHSLKQKFTRDELDQLCNDLRFKGVGWFEALMRSGVEEVANE